MVLFCRSMLLLILGILLTACGGGGSSASTGSSSSSSAPPPSAPQPPTINYVGASGAANLSNNNVGAMSDSLMASVFLALDISDNFNTTTFPAGQSIDANQAGPQGGTAHITGYTGLDGTGWISAQFSSYSEDGVTYDGRQVIETLQTPSPSNNQVSISRVSFHDVRFRATGLDITYSGSITRNEAGGTNNKIVSGSVLINENISGLSFYAQNIDIIRNQANDGTRSVTASSRAFDSRYGYVDVQSDGPWYFKAGELYPHHGSGFRGAGAGGRYFKLSPLTPSVVSLEYAGTSANKLDRSARLIWTESFEEQTTRQPIGTPVADAGASRYVKPGTTIELDARFSTHPQTALLSYQWKLLFRPPGSSAVLDSTTTTRPNITLDMEGRYLVEVTASDGIHIGRDVIVLTADPNMNFLFGPVTAQLTPDESTSISQFFNVDVSLITRSTFDDPVPALSTSGIGGNSLTLGSGGPGNISASFSGSGVYGILLSQGDLSFGGNRPLDIKWIAYNAPMPFSPAGAVALPGADSGSVAGGDLNGDSINDLVVSTLSPQGAGTIQVFYGNTLGLLDTGSSFATGDGGTVAVGDVTGDGRSDIVVATAAGVLIIPQTSNGTLGQYQSIAQSCPGGIGKREMFLADFNGDNLTDVVQAGCTGELDYFLQSSGTLQPPVRVSTGKVSFKFAAGDVTADGIADVVIAGTANVGEPPVFLIPSVRNSIPGNPQALPYLLPTIEPQPPPIAIGDLNRDGLADVIVAENPLNNGINRPRILVFLQSVAGLQSPTANTTRQFTFRMMAADLNHDGAADIITNGSGLNVFYGGSGFLGEQITDLRPTVSLSALTAFPDTVLDINGDGLTDFAYVTNDGSHALLAVALGWRK